MSTSVYYKGSKLIDVNNNTKTLLTSGKYLEGDVTLIDTTSSPSVSSLIVTPTESQQTFNATGVYGYKPVTVNGISSTYVGSGVPLKSSADVYLSDTKIRGPKGYYSVAFSSQISTSNHQNPTIDLDFDTGVITAFHTAPLTDYLLTGAATTSSTYQLNSLGAQTLYPSTADQTIASYRWLTGTQTIKSVTTSNLTAENIAKGVVVKVGDAGDASRITQITGTHQGGGNDFLVTLSQNAYGSLTIDKTFSEIISACKAGKKIAAYGDGSPYYTGAIDVDDEDFNFVEVFGYSYSGNDYLVICEDDYALNSNFSAFVSTKYYYHPDNMNATPSDVASGKRFINWSGFQVGTATGGGYTVDDIAMRTISGDISGNATSIGSYAFYYCSALTTASFPNATSIGSYAFYSCTGLTTASFPNATSISHYAFYNCSVLTTVSFPNVISIGNSAFQYCRSLTTINFPSVTNIGNNAFQFCYSLTTASFPNVRSIGKYVFVYCSSLTTANFPSATNIGSYAFQYCSSLTTINFPSVTNIGNNAFQFCYSLTTASFPNATYIGSSAFYACYNLLSFYLLGSSVPTLATSVFLSTPIVGYTISTGGVYGSIFVPSSLYDQYIVATNWSLISDRIVSV